FELRICKLTGPFYQKLGKIYSDNTRKFYAEQITIL
ncbi:hypothetical protein TNCT_519681, partial [Trichonephila clavata]